MPRAPHAKVTITAAASAGLRETMRELGHRPARDIIGPQSHDHVTVACEECSLALSAYIDHASERVELSGTAFRARCAAAKAG